MCLRGCLEDVLRTSCGSPNSTFQERPAEVRLGRRQDVILRRPQDFRLGRLRNRQIEFIRNVLVTLEGNVLGMPGDQYLPAR